MRETLVVAPIIGKPETYARSSRDPLEEIELMIMSK